ncbi:MAG: glycosyltransferase family 4 protein [Bacteroidota bacterium]|nr:glycosyltransferase family 4 protein [Bacteroidota bacterium]
MKVLHILHELKFSGAEIMYVDAASFFQKKGCQLNVLATAINLGEYAPYFERAGYNVMHKTYPALKNYISRIKYYIDIIRFLKIENFDVVHIHASGTMWGMALCAWIAGKRSVYTFHSVFPTRFFTYPYHCLLRWSAKYIFKCRFQTISDSVFNHELNFFHNRTTKILNWYGSNRFYPSMEGEKSLIRNDLGISTNTLVLISVGGCNHNKRHTDIIEALPIILKEFPDCLYLHLGHGNTESDEIELANNLGVSDHIRFYGNQSNVRKFLIASDIYMMTSRYEGISLTTIEAMACQLPAILYNVPGLRDFNSDGENSILIPENFQVLAENVIFLSRNSGEAQKMALRSRMLVEGKFSLAKNAEKIFNLYK